jgi:hypothetical protein
VERTRGVERTCNAPATDDRNWLAIQALELRVCVCDLSGWLRLGLHRLFAPVVLDPDSNLCAESMV